MSRILLLCTLFFAPVIHCQDISYRLYNHLQESDSEDQIEVILKFSSEVDFISLKSSFRANEVHPKARAALVLNECKKNLDAVLISFNTYLKASGIEAQITPIPIAHAASLSLSKRSLLKILEFELIRYADLNRVSLIIADPPVRNENVLRSPGNHEPGHDLIQAPALWSMGYSGSGTTLLSFDTGFWPAHPAIGNRYKGNFLNQEQCWFPYDLESPGDKSNSHGTHTIGTVLGLDTVTNDTIGVAPGAYFIATDPIVTNVADIKTWEELAQGFEWALNPDGDLNTHDDVPDVINNSWGRPVEGDVEPCEEIMATVFAAVEAAGIANVFSAGNSGPDPMTISAPHNINQGLVNSFTVGAVNMNANLNIAGFSSRGPSLCGGDSSILIKPEVVAPGVNIRSAVNQNEYDNYQGTSMAAPHVSGAVLLLREAFPFLTGEEILLALYHSAEDLGDPGEDNVYGNGMINVLSAFNYLIDLGYSPIPPVNNPYEIAIIEILSPENIYQCDDEISPVLKLKNLGDSAIASFDVMAEVIGTSNFISQSFNMEILPQQEALISLSSFTTQVIGNFELMLNVVLPANQIENDSLNNQRIFRGNIRPTINPDPLYFEDFEQGIPLEEWFIYNDDAAITWDTSMTGGLENSQISAFLNFYQYSPKLNQKDELISPQFNISGNEEFLKLRFDYAYQRRGNSSTLKDTLRVFASIDCGETWNLHWEAFADSLKTISANSSFAFFPDSIHHWKNKSIDLDNYIQSNDRIMVKFQTSNRNGNNLFIDNVELYFGEETVGIQSQNELNVTVWPNPSEGIFELNGFELSQLENEVLLYNAMGALISPSIKYSNNSLIIDLTDFSTGIYSLLIYDRFKIHSKKLIKL